MKEVCFFSVTYKRKYRFTWVLILLKMCCSFYWEVLMQAEIIWRELTGVLKDARYKQSPADQDLYYFLTMIDMLTIVLLPMTLKEWNQQIADQAVWLWQLQTKYMGCKINLTETLIRSTQPMLLQSFEDVFGWCTKRCRGCLCKETSCACSKWGRADQVSEWYTLHDELKGTMWILACTQRTSWKRVWETCMDLCGQKLLHGLLTHYHDVTMGECQS